MQNGHVSEAFVDDEPVQAGLLASEGYQYSRQKSSIIEEYDDEITNVTTCMWS